jgi:microcin C transport system permease protein
MLSLLIFIGEAVRDAFDPRKTFADMPVVAEKAVAGTLAPASGRD